MQPSIQLSRRAVQVPTVSPSSAPPRRRAAVYGCCLLSLLLCWSSSLWAQQYVYQRQLGSQAPVVQFNYPQGVAVDGSGHVYVAEASRIVKLDSSDHFLSQFGSSGSGEGQFLTIGGLAVDDGSNVYVADWSNRIQKFDSSGRFLFQFGSYGSGEGQFWYPNGLAVDGHGHLYVSDSWNHRIQQFDSTGRFLSQFGSYGSGQGQFQFPTAIAVDDLSKLYVLDAGNYRIQKFSSTGRFLTQFASGDEGQYNDPYGMAVDRNGNVYVADAESARIVKLDSTGRFLRQFGRRGTGEGEFLYPRGVAVDGRGQVYVTDKDLIVKFDSSGRFLPQFVSPGRFEGQFRFPSGVAVDGSGNLYVVDTWNNRIQQFDSSGHFLSQFGSYGNGEGQFMAPSGVAVDGKGQVYVTDQRNHCIQKFSSTGQFLVRFGSEGSGEGQFKSPTGVAVDRSGKLYVADQGNNRIQVFVPLVCPGVAFTPLPGSALPAANVGVTYQQAIATDSSGYAFAATGLPPRLAISREGLITGIPTTAKASPDTVTVTVTKGTCQATATYTLAVNKGWQVESFTLVDATTGQDLQPLREGDVLNLQLLPEQLSVRANTDPMEVGSVVFDLNNQQNYRVENFAPYALASNTADDRYVPYNFQEGEYTLSATGYPQANGQGPKGQSLTVHFEVQSREVRPKVAGITLLDAATGQDLQPLQEGDVLDLAKLPAQLSVRANTSPAEVGSVVFDLNNQPNYRVENYWPYALASNQADDRVFLLSQFRSEGNALTVDGAGNLYVSDPHNHRIQKFDSTGRFLLQFGSEGSGEGQFNGPGKLVVDGRGNIYVADYGRIQKFDPEGRFLSRFGQEGSGEGQFSNPRSLAVNGSGQVYVVEVNYFHQDYPDVYRYRVQQFDSSGRFLQQFTSGEFYGLQDVAVDDRGNVYVAESYVMRQPGVHYVSKFDFSGQFLVNFGGEFVFYEPVRVSVDVRGNVYVGDYGNGPTRIYAFDSMGHTLLQFTTQADDGHGPFNFPTYVAGDGRGQIYVADGGNHHIQKFSSSGSYVPYSFQVGEYALSATPYGQANGQGVKGEGLTVHFRVVNSASTARTSVGEGATSLEVAVYPNPFGEQVYVLIQSRVSQAVVVRCYDAQGRQVGKLVEATLEAGQAQRLEVDGQAWPDGLYFLRVSTGQQQLVKKVVRQRR